jgi:hypothetical protein
MKKSVAANLALALIALGWMLSFIGLTGQLGDSDPRVARLVVESEQRMLWGVFFAGEFLAFTSTWLAGYAYAEARIRSLVALAMWLLPLIGLGVWMVASV